jgi:hypothetical protein
MFHLKCYISNTSNGDKIEVSTALKPVEGVNKLGSFITFELSDRFNTKSDQPKNAFDVLVNTAVTLKYKIEMSSLKQIEKVN